MTVPAWLLVLLACGTVARFTRLASKDSLTEPVRAWIEARADRPPRELDKEPKPRWRSLLDWWRRKYDGFWPWLLNLVTCPWCVSVWVGAAVAFPVVWWPTNRVLIAGMVACCGSLLAAHVQVREPETRDEKAEARVLDAAVMVATSVTPSTSIAGRAEMDELIEAVDAYLNAGA